MNNNIHIGGVGSNNIPTHIYYTTKYLDFTIFMSKSLKNYVYRNIYFMCIRRNFFYKGEIEELLFTKINSQIEQLLKYGIIEKATITQDYANFLYSQEGYNYYNVQKMKIYKLTEQAREILTNYEQYIEYYANSSVLSRINKENTNKEQLQEFEEKRFKRIMSKSQALRTIQDNIFIQEYIRKNDTKN